MTPTTFLKKMADPRLNLELLARTSGVDVRVLRRLRNHPPARPRQATMDALVPHLSGCRR